MTYTVAVRELCEFTAKQGDLDLRFTPAPTALEGIAGHAVAASRRGAGYRAEVALSGSYQSLRVRGRADGYDPAQQRIDEVKTFKGRLDRQPASHRHLHWAQAKVYGWLLCEQEQLAHIDVALVYLDVGTQQETVFTERCSAADLRQHFEAQCQRFIAWAEQQVAHRAARDTALTTLAFPFGGFRTGQRPLAEAVYKAAVAGRCLLAQAPTGIGKTMGTLFPLLKAAPAQHIDKVFFLAAKTSGRQMALDALARLADSAPALPLRVLELVARDKACEHPDKACHGESCPLARGFYDRLPAARAAAAQAGWLDKTALRELALEHSVCPYYLGQEMLRWSDVAVGDVNHFFDIGAHWHGLTLEHGWQSALLVDEAHNLIERARAMYSAQLDPAPFQALRRSAPAALKAGLDRLHRQWNALAREQTGDYTVLPEPPGAFNAALQQLCGEIGDHLALHPQDAAGGPLQTWFFDALHFQRVAELHGDHSLCDLTRTPHPAPGTRVAQPLISLRNLVPGPLLQDRWSAVRSATLFSATLAPMDYVADLLGLPADTLRVDVPSPFAGEQLAVRVAPHISTRWTDRLASLTPMADTMAAQFAAEPGNYLAFFSSFDYLAQALDRLQQRHPSIPVWVQSRGMGEPEREAFIARFTDSGQGIGFAVLGGAFGEGIDLPGRRLIGAFIATLGLPQVNPVNEQLKARLQAKFGRGYDYTYLFPGVQKVVQAAGRVIRSEQDHGTVWLLDDRYARAEVRRLLPAWWVIDRQPMG